MQKPLTKFLFLGLLSFLAFVSVVESKISTFTATGSAHTFTVPSNVFEISVVAYGAQGATTGGGEGGTTQAILPVTPGEVLQINVGGKWHDKITTTLCHKDNGNFEMINHFEKLLPLIIYSSLFSFILIFISHSFYL